MMEDSIANQFLQTTRGMWPIAHTARKKLLRMKFSGVGLSSNVEVWSWS